MVELQPIKVITSRQLTREEVDKIWCEFDLPMEKEFRRGSTFYAHGFVEIDAEVAAFVASEFDVDITDQIGMGYYLNGMWSDDDGVDWYYTTLQYAEETYIPEEVKIIPARIEKQWKDYKGV